MFKALSLIIFMMATFTDWFDGLIARRDNLITDFGKFMDPLADKILVFSAFFSFLWMQLISVWMVAVILFRELIITGLRIYAASKGEIIMASKGGKHKTVSQMAVIFIILISLTVKDIMRKYFFWQAQYDVFISNLTYGAMLITVILTLISGISYFWSNRRLFNTR